MSKPYAKYTGETKVFPQGARVEHGAVYQIEILEPRPGWGVWQVKVIAYGQQDVYLPYIDALYIWEEWMPYAGEALR